MNEVMEAIMRRCSVRAYADTPIRESDRDQILSAAIHAPNGMNRQRWHFSAVTDSKWLEALRCVVRDYFQRVVITDTMPQVFGVFQKKANEDPAFSFFHSAPMVVIASSERGYPNGAADCAAAIENMLIAAAGMGLGSCWVTTLNSICDEKPIRALLTKLGVPEDHVVMGAAVVGYASGELEKPPRNSTSITIIAS